MKKFLFFTIFVIIPIFSANFTTEIKINNAILIPKDANSSKIDYCKSIWQAIDWGNIIDKNNIIDDQELWENESNKTENHTVKTGDFIILDKNSSGNIITMNIYDCIAVAFNTADGTRGLFHLYNNLNKEKSTFDAQIANLKIRLESLSIEQKKQLNIVVVTAFFSSNLKNVVDTLELIARNPEGDDFFYITYNNIFPLYFDVEKNKRDSEKSKFATIYFRNDLLILWNFHKPKKTDTSQAPTNIATLYNNEWFGPKHVMIDSQGKIFTNKYSINNIMSWNIQRSTNQTIITKTSQINKETGQENKKEKTTIKSLKTILLFVSILGVIGWLLFLKTTYLFNNR